MSMPDQKTSRPELRISRRRRGKQHSKGGRCHDFGGRMKKTAPEAAVAKRLEALRNLIPHAAEEDEAASDRLFEETADYILLLKTQVEVLKRLVDVYSGAPRAEAPPGTAH